MPRITGRNIPEHVAQQTTAIIDAAAELFTERGIDGTDIADIARQVGLARPSLYRYFPDKHHILLAWYEREMGPVIARTAEILSASSPADVRLADWLDYRMDQLAKPDHDSLIRLTQDAAAVSPEIAQAVGDSHGELYLMLGQVMGDALEANRPKGAKRRDPILVTRVLNGIASGAAQAVAQGTDPRDARAEAHRCLHAVLRA